MAVPCLAFWSNVRHSKPFHILISRVWGFWFLQNLVVTCLWACGRECAPMSACAPSFHPVLPCFCLCWARLARKLPSSWSSLLSQIFPCQHTAGTATCTIMLYGFHGVGINLRLSVFYPLLSWSPDIPVKCPTIELQLFLNYNSFSGFYFYFPNVSNVGRVYFMCFFWGRGTINISFH